jgi:hypothetical protein
MPWNETDREKYAVLRGRYASDLSDQEFALVQPLLPAAKPRGRKPTDPRTILNALFYLVRAGCPWRFRNCSGGWLEASSDGEFSVDEIADGSQGCLAGDPGGAGNRSVSGMDLSAPV